MSPSNPLTGCPDPKLVSGMEKIDIGLGDSLHYSKDFVEADGLYPRGTLVKAKCAEGHSLGGSPQTPARVRIRCTKQVRSCYNYSNYNCRKAFPRSPQP